MGKKLHTEADRKPSLSRSLLCGAAASAAVTLLWFFIKGKSGAAAGLLITTAAVFVLTAAVFRLTENCGRKCRAVCRSSAAVVSFAAFFIMTGYVMAPSFLFHPRFDEASYNVLCSCEAAEEISFEGNQGIISGWLIDSGEERPPLVLYFGGNSENSASRVRWLIENQDFSAFKGCDFVFLDYPGYGKSSGIPGDESFRQFGLDAYDYFAGRYEKIVVMGYSIGTGVANYTASQRETDGLVLMAPYADGYDLYNNYVNIFYGPMRCLVEYKMEAVEFARDITVKPLILASPDDRVVSFNSSVRLSSAYPSGCEFVAVEGIAHGGFFSSEMVMESIKEYLGEVVQ